MFTFFSRTRWKLPGEVLFLLAAAAAVPFLFTTNASAAEPKRVLLIHSFGNATPQARSVSIAFETQLAEKMGGQVDLDQFSLDMGRYPDRDSQEAIVDYLQKRGAKWRPDIVVTMAAPAAIFVAEHRDRLFSEVPVLYASLDRRLLPPGALDKNAIYVGQEFRIPGWIEDIVQIAPGTKNIEVVVGTTPLERVWQEAFQKAAEPFAGRIKFTYYNDLPFAQILHRVAKLPPDSYIFLLVFLRDASGITRTTDEALQRLHEVANAPINSIFSHQLGQGIVGGRLYQSDRIGKEAADAAIRVLEGQPASSFVPVQIDPLPPRYDWRELQRWKINEKLLPPGSTVLFREPTVWERYRAWILGGISVVLLQGLLIAGLLANLVKRHRAERSLTESEHRFQNVANTAPVLIWMSGMNNEGIFFNKTWLQFTGRTMDEECGDGWLKGVHPDDLPHCVEICGTGFKKREPFTIEFRLRRKDGEYRWVLDTGTPRFEAGKFVGYIGSCIDITERRQAELDHHVQSTELARVGRMALMGELAASLAHEVNNPLGAMVANASAGQRMLARNALGEEELRELLADIVSDGHRAREVIEGIRNMVRKSEVSYAPIRPNEIIRDLVRIVRADAVARRINLVTKIDENIGQVMGNRVQLLQVLLNLTMNAFDALGAIRPDARRVVIQAEPLGETHICLSVQDSGPGFPAGIVDKLFEAFFTTKTEGTGMGLAIARSIIEAHDGTLSGENVATGGALFTICLPTLAGREAGTADANASVDSSKRDS
jgi:PAS domain S-box-containing protein